MPMPNARAQGRVLSVAGPRLLVVVPTLNEANDVENVIHTLLSGSKRAASTRLVVSDGGSTDGTLAAVARIAEVDERVQCLENTARIQSAGINLAARAFGGEADVLVRCDAHAEYPPGFCDHLLDALATSGADAVVVAMDSIGDAPLQRAVAWVSNSAIGTGGAAHRGGRRSGLVDHGHHAAFRFETFCRVGGYDETFTHNEDAELDCRQRAAGARIYLDAGIRIRYRPRGTWPGLARQYYRYGWGRSRTVRRHPRSLRIRQLAVPVHALVCIACLALAPWAPVLLAWPAAYAIVLGATSLRIAVRERSAAGLLAGGAALVMHCAWAAGFLAGLLRSRDAVWRPGATPPLDMLPWQAGGADVRS